jgi:ABC-type spermidine/putrescine transport system permease subunit II
MLRDMCALFLERKEFFLKLLWEHLEISMISILIAIVLGGLVGILISEYQQSAKPAMGVINFLYTIPSTRMSSPRQKIFSEKEKFQIIKSMIIWNPSFFMLHTNHLVQDFYRWATNFHK